MICILCALTGVIAQDGGPAPSEYDRGREPLNASVVLQLGNNPGGNDEDMTPQLLLDCFMELWHECLWGRT